VGAAMWVKGLNYHYVVKPTTEESTLRATTTEIVYTFVLLFSQNLNESFEIQITAQLSDGTIATIYTTQISYIEAGTGGLQVSLSFDNDKDVDLYVVQPDGEVIFYGNRGEKEYNSETGKNEIVWGLDIDSNAGCIIDGINNENIFYPKEYIQSGKYEVWVNMFKNCNSSIPTNWVVNALQEGSLVSVSYGRNPANGVFPVGTPSNSIDYNLNTRAIKVMEFTMVGARVGGARSAKTTPIIDESAVLKLKAAGELK
jgi:hypothetical protein